MNNDPVAVTSSLCPECLTTVKAMIVERGGQYYLDKYCPRHGRFTALHPLDIPEQYQAARNIFSLDSRKTLIPRDLIIYVTNRCNQKCPICYNDADQSRLKEPSLKEILTKIEGFRGEYVHLSGGEPLLRADIGDIISAVKSKGFKVGIFSNGKLLARREAVAKLKHAGIDLVIMQFDSMRDRDYMLLRGEPLLEIKKKAVEQCAYFHIPVYLFAVIVDGLNHDQLEPLFKFASENVHTVKILNINPVWEICRNKQMKRISNARLYQEIERQLKFSLDEFLECAEISHYLFQIYAAVLGNRLRTAWVRQPPCAQRMYFVKGRRGVVPVGMLMDLKKCRQALKGLSESLHSRHHFSVLLLPSILSLFLWFLRFVLFRAWFWQLVYACSERRYVLRRTQPGPMWAYMPVFSFMVGTFHNKFDVDLEMIRKCTLYADMPGSTRIVPACMRQIYFERDHYRTGQKSSLSDTSLKKGDETPT